MLHGQRKLQLSSPTQIIPQTGIQVITVYSFVYIAYQFVWVSWILCDVQEKNTFKNIEVVRQNTSLNAKKEQQDDIYGLGRLYK